MAHPSTDSVNTNKIDNLHSFPVEVLEKMFMRTDDVGLLNLANTCQLSRAKAKHIFSKRYADKYFVINEIEKNRTVILKYMRNNFVEFLILMQIIGPQNYCNHG